MTSLAKNNQEKMEKKATSPENLASGIQVSRFSLYHVFALLLTVYIGSASLTAYFWVSQLRENSEKKAYEGAVKINRTVARDVVEFSEKIQLTLGKVALPGDKNLASPEQDFQTITGSLERPSDTHLYRLDSNRTIKQVSHPQDKKLLGRVFDEGLGIRFRALGRDLFVSEMAPGRDTKNPVFEWRKKYESGSIILQSALQDFGNRCKQLSFLERQDVYYSLSSGEGRDFRVECGTNRDLNGIWKALRKKSGQESFHGLVSAKSQDYQVSYQQLNDFPLNVAVFVRVPNKLELLSESSYIIYSLIGLPIFLYLLILYLFRVHIASHNDQILALCTNLSHSPKEPMTQLNVAKEYEPAFSSLLSMYDSFDTILFKSSLKTKLTTDLSSVYSVNNLFSKATELIGIHTRSEACFFLPKREGSETESLKGWAWAKPTLKEIQLTDEENIYGEITPKGPFKIPARMGADILGDFYLVAPRIQDKILFEIAPSFVNLIDIYLRRNKELLGEALKDLENKTSRLLMARSESPRQIERSDYEIASHYLPPHRQNGHFYYILTSPKSENFFVFIGGPIAIEEGLSDPQINQMSIPLISWTIKGTLDAYRHIFESSESPLNFSPRDVVLAIDRAVRDVAPHGAVSWTYFGCSYSHSMGLLTYCSLGRREPIFLLKEGERNADELERLRLPYQAGILSPLSNLEEMGGLKDAQMKIAPGDVVLILPGSASVDPNDRHQLFHDILARRLATLESGLSMVSIRDYFRELQAYYYQNQSLDKDLCIFLFHRLRNQAQSDQSHAPNDLAS